VLLSKIYLGIKSGGYVTFDISRQKLEIFADSINGGIAPSDKQGNTSGKLCNPKKPWILKTAAEIIREVNLKTDKNGWNWARKANGLMWIGN
jgi:hypothetical protein